MSSNRVANENVISLTNRGRTMIVDRRPAAAPGIQYSALLSFGSRPATYLVIRWAPDKKCFEACCEHAYFLYRLGEKVELVLENLYGCDV